MTLREFWTPTRVLRNRLRIGSYAEYYDLYPDDLLHFTSEEGWVKEGPGQRIAGLAVSVLTDNLQACVVEWNDDTRTYLFIPSIVGEEFITQLGLRMPLPVPDGYVE